MLRKSDIRTLYLFIATSSIAGIALMSFLPFSSHLSATTAQRHLMPGGYTIPPGFRPVSLSVVTSSEELLPAARNLLETWVEMEPGDRVRIVLDDSVPEVVTDAFYRVSSQRGLKVHIEQVPLGDLSSRSIAQLSQESFDTTLLLAYFPEPDSTLETPQQDPSQRFVRVVSVPELLASDWARMPFSLMEAIARAKQQEVSLGSVARITDRAGTDFSFEYVVEEKDDSAIRKSLLAQFPPSFQVSLRVSDKESAAGWIATHSSLPGFFPLGRFKVDQGILASLEGGGSLGERLTAALLDKSTSVGFEELRLSTSPLALRYSKGYHQSPFRWGHEAASQRAGVATFWFRVSTKGQPGFGQVQDFQVYFPTLVLGNRTLIEEGYLKTLENSEVVQLAATLGASRWLIPQCGAESLPILPDHENPTLQVVTSSETLKPGIQNMFREWIRLDPEEKVLVLSDRSVPPLLFGAVLEEIGTGRSFEIAEISVPTVSQDAADRLQSYSQFDLPEETWDQMAAADVVVALSHFPFDRLRRGERSFQEWLPTVETRFIAAAGLPEVFASPWGKFPVSLLRQLARHTFSRVRLAQDLTLTTGEGTQLAFQFQSRRSIPRILPDTGLFEYHAAPANYFFFLSPVRADVVEGTIITRQVEGMTVPAMTLTIKGGRIAQVEGGGSAGVLMRQRSEEEEGLRLRRIGTYVNPKAFPWEASPYRGWTPSFWAASGNIFRAGIVHIEFAGTSTVAVQLQLGTLKVGNRELISRGRLVVLQDPNLNRFARGEGLDPDKWLSEDWIPPIGR